MKAPAPAERGTLAADVERYLKQVKTLTSWKSKRSELRAWCALYGSMNRRQLKAEHVRRAFVAWMRPDDAKTKAATPKTVINRVRALTALYHVLDGKRARTPADDVDLPKRRRRRPDYVPTATIVTVERNLRAMERRGDLPDATLRARFRVIASTRQRPV